MLGRKKFIFRCLCDIFFFLHVLIFSYVNKIQSTGMSFVHFSCPKKSKPYKNKTPFIFVCNFYFYRFFFFFMFMIFVTKVLLFSLLPLLFFFFFIYRYTLIIYNVYCLFSLCNLSLCEVLE